MTLPTSIWAEAHEAEMIVPPLLPWSAYHAGSTVDFAQTEPLSRVDSSLVSSEAQHGLQDPVSQDCPYRSQRLPCQRES